jgi:hypothetical protein
MTKQFEAQIAGMFFKCPQCKKYVDGGEIVWSEIIDDPVNHSVTVKSPICNDCKEKSDCIVCEVYNQFPRNDQIEIEYEQHRRKHL